MKIFIFLAHELDINLFEKLYKNGFIEEKTPYNYHYAKNYGCDIFFHQSKKENFLEKLLRRVVRKILGFDIIHSFRNLKQMEKVDVVWTHTEQEFLGVLFLLKKIKKRKDIKVISQIIWLADNWKGFSFLKKKFYSYLIEDADILTFHSYENKKFMDRLFPNIKKEVIYFGIDINTFFSKPKFEEITFPIKVLSVGNDIHRDWDTLFEALGNKNNVVLKILSEKKVKVRKAYKNISVNKVFKDKLRKYYRWADIVVVPLKENMHVSGITTILEAVASGKPVIATDTGGLKAYFSSEDIYYVPVGDPEAIYRGIFNIAKDLDLRKKLVLNAQKTLFEKNFSRENFIKRHCEISRELLSK